MKVISHDVVTISKRLGDRWRATRFGAYVLQHLAEVILDADLVEVLDIGATGTGQTHHANAMPHLWAGSA